MKITYTCGVCGFESDKEVNAHACEVYHSMTPERGSKYVACGERPITHIYIVLDVIDGNVIYIQSDGYHHAVQSHPLTYWNTEYRILPRFGDDEEGEDEVSE